MQDLNSMKNDGELSSNLESEEIKGRQTPRDILIGCVLLCVTLSVIAAMSREPWPIIWNKEALVKECGEWMKACKGIRKWGRKPPMPPRIAGISCTSSKVGYTYVEDDHVAIFVAEKEASLFEAIWGGYTTYFYIVFPRDYDNPNYRPRPNFPCEPTRHPYIFKRKRTYEFDNATSGYVEVTDSKD